MTPSMRCSTWRGNALTKLNRQVQLWVCPRFKPLTPHLCISYTGREPVYLLSFIPSASCRSISFTIFSPSPLLGLETPQQVQATSDRSRISTKARSPITCVTGCATKSQLDVPTYHNGICRYPQLCRKNAQDWICSHTLFIVSQYILYKEKFFASLQSTFCSRSRHACCIPMGGSSQFRLLQMAEHLTLSRSGVSIS